MRWSVGVTANQAAPHEELHFIEIPRERGGGRVPFPKEELAALRGLCRGVPAGHPQVDEAQAYLGKLRPEELLGRAIS